jgi:hypothetical protein
MVECCTQYRVVPCHRFVGRRFDGVAPSFAPPFSVLTGPRESIEDGMAQIFPHQVEPCPHRETPPSGKDTEDLGAFATLDVC